MARGVPDEDLIVALERMGHPGLAAISVGLKRATVEARVKKMGIEWRKNRKWEPRDDAELPVGGGA